MCWATARNTFSRPMRRPPPSPSSACREPEAVTRFKRIAIALVLLTAALAPAHAAEKITCFVSDIAVQRNGDLLVTETIAVNAEGDRIKRGILREFPTSYKNSDGSHVEVGFAVLSVKRDGASE